MENIFEKTMDDIMIKTPAVTGILCADQQGLCLGVRGKADCDSSGAVTNLANKVQLIEPANKEYPVIYLESNNLQCMIQKQENMTLAIYRSQPTSTVN